MKDKAMIVMNPIAGGGKGMQYRKEIIASIEKKYHHVECFLTREKNDGTLYGEKACEEKWDAIFCVGGDGTIQEVVQGLAEKPYRPTVGVIPLGTYNALARILNIPLSLEKNLKKIGDYTITNVDIGKANDRYFLFLMSIGKLSESFHQVTSEQKGKFGVLSYFFEGVKRIPEDRPYEFMITTPEERIEVSSSLLVFALTNYVGG
ncbi:MAG: YegS/Rv2252/BmrU family lipid kinase, partial [Clostridiales bacterium]|nr:YegS/Rv2252/BmrU family lipid kinase [Clostridiales bacterium]